LKKIFFQALAKQNLEKNFFQKFSKIGFFRKVDFGQKNYLEVVFATSNAKKSIFWMILCIFCAGNFFHTTFSFFYKSA